MLLMAELIKKLDHSFFNRPTLLVAEELLGKILVFNNNQAIITETEAYHGFSDPASHAFRGETPRTKPMFGKAGYSYVYLIYGMYHCLNIVTEEEGYPAAVLIRGARLLNSNARIDGPGKLCRHLGITKAQNIVDMTKDEGFYIKCIGHKPNFTLTPRIGIKLGKDKLWRFVAQY